MKNTICLSFIFFALLFHQACNQPKQHTYQDDLLLLSQKAELIELSSPNGLSRLFISPQFQGKVLSSTNDGLQGYSQGWLNYEGIAQDHKNIGSGIGGEERVWIGPLGGQHSFYFQQVKPIHDDNWKVPAPIDSEPFQLIDQSDSSVKLSKEFQLSNFIGTQFKLKLKRNIELLNNQKAYSLLNLKTLSNIKMVAYESSHTLINAGKNKWTTEKGLASLWSLNMLKGTNQSNVIIPLPYDISTDSIYKYLSPIKDDRLFIKDQALIFKTDGKYRSKIGIPNTISPSIYGSYQPEINTLHIVQYQIDGEPLYFNSEVSEQENPYLGEAIPIYNHGPMDLSIGETNSFYEMESCSSMKELAPKDSLFHFHRMFHFTGSKKDLNQISKSLLGVDLMEY